MKNNQNYGEDYVDKKIYSEEISKERKKLTESFYKNDLEINFRDLYKEFLMQWKDAGFSVDKFRSFNDINQSSSIQGLKESLIKFFKLISQDLSLLNNLNEIMQRGGKVNEEDNIQAIENFSLLSILLDKKLIENQNKNTSSNISLSSDIEEIELIDDEIDKEADDDFFDVYSFNKETIFCDQKKSYSILKAGSTRLILDALRIESEKRLSDISLNYYNKENIQINDFFTKIITYDSVNESDIKVNIKDWIKQNITPDLLILAEADLEKSSVIFKGVLTSDELYNLLNKDKKINLDNEVIIKPTIFKGGIDRIFYLAKILDPFSIKKEQWKKNNNLKINKITGLNKDLPFTFKQLSNYLKCGVPLVECLEMTAEDVNNTKLGKILHKISSELRDGEMLSNSFGRYFDNLLIIKLIEAGEGGGILSDVLLSLSEYIEKDVLTQSRLQRIFNSIFVFLSFALFIYSSGIFPLMNKYPIYYFLPSLLFICCISYVFDQPKIYILDKFAFNIPIINKYIIQKLSSNLYLLLVAGIPLIESLEISKNSSNNMYFKQSLEFVQKKIRNGEELSKSFSNFGSYPNQFINMIQIGEETGSLVFLLEQIKEIYSKNYKRDLQIILNIFKNISYIFIIVLLLFLIKLYS